MGKKVALEVEKICRRPASKDQEPSLREAKALRMVPDSRSYGEANFG
jgi:hypothetical protein